MQDARYNVDGLRHRKLDKNGNSSEEYGVGISTAASTPGSGSSNAPSISYIHSDAGILGAEVDGSFVFHLPDHLGSNRDVINDQGTVIRSFEFSEYGDLISSWSSGTGAVSPKTWIGGLSVNDDTADSGMFNMGHRNFLSNGGVLGRFISRDPIGHAGDLNLYGYVNANPVSFTDSTGLQTGAGDPDWNPETGDYESNPWTQPANAESMLMFTESALNASMLVVVVAEGLPVAGYVLARAGLYRLGGCVTGFGLEASSAWFGSQMLHHGSKNAPSVRQSGLRTSPGSRGAFVSPNRAAAENAISRSARGGELSQRGVRKNGVWTNDYVIPDSDLGVVKFKIPNNQMRRFPANPKEYPGWGGEGLGWKEIEVTNDLSLWILNQGMCK
jgi:RHS repeat-associated protein